MRKYIALYVTFVLIIALTGGILYIKQPVSYRVDTKTMAVDLNEVYNLYDSGNTAAADGKAKELMENLNRVEEKGRRNPAPLIVSGVGIVLISFVFFSIYNRVLKPFNKLTDLADRIAKGDMEIPLEYERTNYFGKFTWAFDRMRQNVRNSKESEREAIENNKTVIASLSHDIRTPVSSIRAYAEALEADMAATPEEKAKYISVILSKCDEVTRLTDDMLLHSLSDMDRLNVEISELDLIALSRKTSDELGCGFVNETGADVLKVSGDSMRIIQVIENLVRNSLKYADSDVEIKVQKDEEYAFVSVSDRGNGIPDEDLPFVFDKFYRGSNTGNVEGSGLGLYIVKYLITKMKGEVRAENVYPGLVVKFSLPLVR